MRLPTLELSAAQGNQTPRIQTVPAYVSSTGAEAIELAELAGITLDPWQELVLTHALGERADGQWAASEVGLVVSRQNGKGTVLEARALAGLFLIGERLQIWSAHQYDTSMEAYRRLKFLIENTPELDRRVRRYINAHGEEGIELKSGQRIRFRTRTKGGGRGFSGDCAIFDEAMIFSEASLAAILPIVSARPNPQVWYAGSAVDQVIHDDGLVLSRVRDRGIRGEDGRLAYFEWSLDRATPGDVDPETAESVEAWAEANPALGIRIAADYIAGERLSLGPRAFAVERLGVGDWPDPSGTSGQVIDPERWKALKDEHSKLLDPVCFAFDVTPDRSSASISAAGVRTDGLYHIECTDNRPGTGWIQQRLRELRDRHKPLAIVCDGGSSAGSLIVWLEQAGLEIVAVTAKEHAQACGIFYDAVQQGELRHLGSRELDTAVRSATKRPLGDAWAWNRKTSVIDISPLVACTLALAGYREEAGKKPAVVPRVVSLHDIE